MLHNWLTDVPSNLKEGIDWLIALRGTDAEKNLGAMGKALYGLLADKPVGFTEVPALEEVKRISKEFLEQKELKCQPFVEDLLKRYTTPLRKLLKRLPAITDSVEESDYKNVVETRGIKPKDIAKYISEIVHNCENLLNDITKPHRYATAYSPEATWDSSCAKDPEACAVILVGIAPMLYTGLRSLQVASADALEDEPYSKAKERVEEVLKAVGYKETECRASMSGSDIRKALGGINDRVLQIIHDIAGFWAS
ncbi:hypothetical protein, conserved [Babesia ovata]|uniref:Uncharacterized protein n=1 Tax=Babesia ovata TaxID=189622 RepID=A0A2H6KC87_9APIC|nr:uncharacterized protein BOVATA_021010 [Babesia ovata]GBE60608.1 hypothetical protein, conserved [Babesia ovata]